MRWLRHYLWLNSSQLINGYNPFGMNSLGVDVLLRTSYLGYGIYVLNFMAWILAEVD